MSKKRRKLPGLVDPIRKVGYCPKGGPHHANVAGWRNKPTHCKRCKRLLCPKGEMPSNNGYFEDHKESKQARRDLRYFGECSSGSKHKIMLRRWKKKNIHCLKCGNMVFEVGKLPPELRLAAQELEAEASTFSNELKSGEKPKGGDAPAFLLDAINPPDWKACPTCRGRVVGVALGARCLSCDRLFKKDELLGMVKIAWLREHAPKEEPVDLDLPF